MHTAGPACSAERSHRTGNCPHEGLRVEELAALGLGEALMPLPLSAAWPPLPKWEHRQDEVRGFRGPQEKAPLSPAAPMPLTQRHAEPTHS